MRRWAEPVISRRFSGRRDDAAAGGDHVAVARAGQRGGEGGGLAVAEARLPLVREDFRDRSAGEGDDQRVGCR